MNRLKVAMIWLGGAALLAATGIDTLAVLGRQLGLPLKGSIELVQAAVLVAGSIALICATLADRHARVRLLVDRLGAGLRAVVGRASEVLSALFLACLLIGSAWIAADLWDGHERSEIMGVPWLWLRLFANLSLLVIVVLTVRRAFAGKAA